MEYQGETIEQPKKQSRINKILAKIVNRSYNVNPVITKMRDVLVDVAASRAGTNEKNKLLASLELTPEAKKALKTTAVKAYSPRDYYRNAPANSDGVAYPYKGGGGQINVQKGKSPGLALHELSHITSFGKGNEKARLKSIDSMPDWEIKNDLMQILANGYDLPVNPNARIPEKGTSLNEIKSTKEKPWLRDQASEEGIANLADNQFDYSILKDTPDIAKIVPIINYSKSLPMSKAKGEKVNPIADFLVNYFAPAVTPRVNAVKAALKKVTSKDSGMPKSKSSW